MRIGVASSMQNSEKTLEIVDELKRRGHDAFCSIFTPQFVGKSNAEKEKIKLNQKYNHDAIREFWKLMQNADALLVLNLDKGGIVHYIGGNTLMEIGFAHVLGQKIFLWNPIPEIPYYKTEIEAMRPLVINGDLSLI